MYQAFVVHQPGPAREGTALAKLLPCEVSFAHLPHSCVGSAQSCDIVTAALTEQKQRTAAQIFGGASERGCVIPVVPWVTHLG